MTETPNKLCLQCSKPFKGRTDKKFCCHYCRTDYNNIKQKAKLSESIKYINEILLNNRDILMELIQVKVRKTTEDKLIARGFHFHFHTHIIKNGSKIKKYCYDVGYINFNGTVEVLLAE